MTLRIMNKTFATYMALAVFVKKNEFVVLIDRLPLFLGRHRLFVPFPRHRLFVPFPRYRLLSPFHVIVCLSPFHVFCKCQGSVSTQYQQIRIEKKTPKCQKFKMSIEIRVSSLNTIPSYQSLTIATKCSKRREQEELTDPCLVIQPHGKNGTQHRERCTYEF